MAFTLAASDQHSLDFIRKGMSSQAMDVTANMDECLSIEKRSINSHNLAAAVQPTAYCSIQHQFLLWTHQALQSQEHITSQRAFFNASRGETRVMQENRSTHPQTAAIIRQVEYYFSDENLPQDAHLLSLTGKSGDGWVSLNYVLSFKKMRSYKPPASVKAALAHSTRLEIWKNKLIRRKDPLEIPLRVEPRRDIKKEQAQKLVDEPWLTKGMLKPTGFETSYVDAPLTPEEHDLERELFDPEEAFIVRIENAISRFCSRRKFHQHAEQVFTKFLMFGGFDTGSLPFASGIKKRNLDELNQGEKSEPLARYTVLDSVWEGLDPDTHNTKWLVDFEGMAKAFLSSRFFVAFKWKDQQTVIETIAVLRSFYSWLRIHDVCPEYDEAIRKSLAVCAEAEEELPNLSRADDCLPGSFNVACSILHGGDFALKRPANKSSDWFVEGDDQNGLPDSEAWKILIAGVMAYGVQEQKDLVLAAAKGRTTVPTLKRREIGLEVLNIEPASVRANQIYRHEQIRDTEIKPMGLLICKRWDVPHGAPRDLPQEMIRARKQQKDEVFNFLLEEDALQNFKAGTKFEAIVGESQFGLRWIDAHTFVYPSFYTWTLNERIREWKDPGPPKAWMERQTQGKETGLSSKADQPGNRLTNVFGT